jgi:hypothetical protein
MRNVLFKLAVAELLLHYRILDDLTANYLVNLTLVNPTAADDESVGQIEYTQNLSGSHG